MSNVKLINSGRENDYSEYNEIIISSTFNFHEAKKFIEYIQKYKIERNLNQIYIRVPRNWHSNNEGRKILLQYLKETQDYLIIEFSPILRAILKTELTMIEGDPQRIIKERE